MKKLACLFLIICFIFFSCKQVGGNKDTNISDISSESTTEKNIKININENFINGAESDFVYKIKEDIVFVKSQNSQGPSEIIRKNIKGEKSTILKSQKFINDISVINDETILYSVIIDYFPEYIQCEYYKFNLTTEESTKLNNNHEEIGDLFYCDGQLFLTRPTHKDNGPSNKTKDLYFELNDEFFLIDKDITYFEYVNNNVYYQKYGESDIKKYNLKTQTTIIIKINNSLDTSFCVIDNYILFETLGSLNLFNCDNNSVESLKTNSYDSYVYDTSNCISNNKYIYIYNYSEGLVRISKESKKVAKILEKNIIDNIDVIDNKLYLLIRKTDKNQMIYYDIYTCNLDGTDFNEL